MRAVILKDGANTRRPKVSVTGTGVALGHTGCSKPRGLYTRSQDGNPRPAADTRSARCDRREPWLRAGPSLARRRGQLTENGACAHRPDRPIARTFRAADDRVVRRADFAPRRTARHH